MLGTGDLQVSAIGLGCMGLVSALGPPPIGGRASKSSDNAVDRGVTLFNTAEAYGPWTNEDLVGEALERVEENLGAANVVLTADDLGEIETAAAKIHVEGARLPEAVLQFSYR